MEDKIKKILLKSRLVKEDTEYNEIHVTKNKLLLKDIIEVYKLRKRLAENNGKRNLADSFNILLNGLTKSKEESVFGVTIMSNDFKGLIFLDEKVEKIEAIFKATDD